MSKIYDKLKDLENINEDELEHIEIVDENTTPLKTDKKRSFLTAAILIIVFFVAMFAGLMIAKYFTNISMSKNREVVSQPEKSETKAKSQVENKENTKTAKAVVKKQQPVVLKGGAEFVKSLEKKYYDDPNNPVNANNLSVAYIEQKRFEDALKYAEKALLLAPDNAYFWNNLGVVLTYLNLFTDAEKCFKKALELSKDEGVFYYNIANLYERMGNLEFSKQNYLSYITKSDKINPSNVEIVRNLMLKGVK